VKDQLVSVLAGMHHHRIDYPTAPGSEDPVAAAAPQESESRGAVPTS
jgi:hypothetical protein